MKGPHLATAVAVFTHGVRPAHAEDLMEGFTADLQKRAVQELKQVESLSSGGRKAKALSLFGPVPDFDRRLRELRESLPEDLDVSLEVQLPTRFRRSLGVVDSGPRARQVLAARLVRGLLR